MRRTLVIGAALGAALLAALGYGLAPKLGFTRTPQQAVMAAHEPASARKVLYWKDPDGKADFSPSAKKTANGRDYLPVYDEEEPQLPGTKTAAPATGKGKLLYYRNPMGLADTSPVPKKDWMGMDYIPVYEGEEQDSSTVKVSLDKVQRAGVRTEPASERVLTRAIRAPGIAKPDERTLRTVSLRADGFIEKLYVDQTGQHVVAGEPMFRVYSPQLVTIQTDYIVAVGGNNRDQGGALQRLKNFAMPKAALDELQRTRTPVMSIDWPAPVSGVVMSKNIIEGQMARAGDELFRLADLSSIWVIADVAEQDLAQVKVGAPVKLGFRAYPGEAFDGKVTFILHELDAATRTAKVRIEVKNPDHRLKHEMFADVTIDAGADEAPRLAVPLSAVIDSGSRQVVLVEKGEGRFEPRAVKLGMRGNGYAEVLDGVKDGEKVVVAATFLIDAESNLKAALAAFTAEPRPEAKP